MKKRKSMLPVYCFAAAVLAMFLEPVYSTASWLHHAAKDAYVKQVMGDLKGYALILGNYEAHPPKRSTSAQDDMYITRGEMDISIVEEKVRRYQKGDVAKSVVEDCLKQLERDIEDTPPLDDDRSKS